MESSHERLKSLILESLDFRVFHWLALHKNKLFAWEEKKISNMMWTITGKFWDGEENIILKCKHKKKLTFNSLIPLSAYCLYLYSLPCTILMFLEGCRAIYWFFFSPLFNSCDWNVTCKGWICQSLCIKVSIIIRLIFFFAKKKRRLDLNYLEAMFYAIVANGCC